MILRTFTTCLLASCLVTPAAADSFTRFKFKEYEGWVEDTGSAIRVQVIPFLLGPDTTPPSPGGFFNFSIPVGHDAPRIQMLPDGRIRLPYKIINVGLLPQDAWPVISASTGIDQSLLASAPVSFVKAKLHRVTLTIAGEVVSTQNLGGGTIAGDPVVSFYLPPDRPELLDSLRANAYSVVLDYEHDLADVSSLTLDMSVEQVSNMWVDAFREVTRSKSSSGGKFLFFNFSRKISRTRVKEAITSGATEEGLTDITIVLRDPTPGMEARVNEVLGFAQTTRTEMLQRHQAAYTAAIAAGNPKLAEAHLQYLEELGPDAPNDNGAALQAALSKLKDAEGLQFLAAGFQISESSSSSYYRYNFAMSAAASTIARTSYREYLIRNSMVQSRYYAHKDQGSMPAALAAAATDLHNSIFPMVTIGQPLNQLQWSAGALQAIENRNLAALRYIFSPTLRETVRGLDIDAPVDGQGNRLVHRAARKVGSQPMLEILLRGGASPLVRNAIDDLPVDSASDVGETATANFLRSEAARRGSFTATLSVPGATKLELFYLKPEEAAAPTVTPLDLSSARLDYQGYPRTTQLGGIARISFQLPMQCAMVNFQSWRQPNFNDCNVVQDVAFTGALRIRENGQTKLNGEFKYMGPSTGYVFQPLTIVP